MLKINYSPISPVFTSAIPTQITITTDSNTAVTVTVEIEGASGFTTTLYPYDGKAVFHDLRSIIEQSLLASNNRQYAAVILSAKQGDASASTSECVFIFSRLALSATGLTFTPDQFLTTAQSFLLPRSATQYLSFFATSACTSDDYTDCVVRPSDGSMPKTVRVSDGTNTVQANSLYTFSVSPASLQEKVKDDGTLLAFTVHRGGRSKTFYLTDNALDISLLLLNEFLAPEYVHLHAVTKTKLSLDRSFATSQGSLSFYDDNSADEYETESAMLTPYEAKRLSRLLLSPTIKVSLNDNASRTSSLLTHTYTPIIITDLSSEISDAHNATNTLKFQWKYRTPQFPHTVPTHRNNFDDPFSSPFD